MKRCADLTAKSVSFIRGAISSQKNRKKKLVIGSTLLICGFFYWSFSSFDSPENRRAFPFAYAKSNVEKKTVSLCNPSFLKKNTRKLELEIFPDFCDEDTFKSKEELLLEQKQKISKEQLFEILGGTPMEEMIEPILEQKKIVAAFLVGIAFKESKFGVYSPKKNGERCYNYWGFKGKTSPTRSGYSCFSNPKEAITIVGRRLEQLTTRVGATRPSQMTVWKCGSSCATHSPQSVQKWISDVALFHAKVMKIDI
ncbi:hypothetical protein HN784_00750 [bacterium]|jgi:hypothetical protein|nr:hypothetical protein [bacterium]MBT4251605.1 hypothetical protein [bacterium]MBT4597654.1 hypothetical protein [bacterium]MBT6753667.1 hypothetical protein [bacterium]MBT7037804.1 hypothetical protein [bacterium]